MAEQDLLKAPDFPPAAPIIAEALETYLSQDFMSVPDVAAKYRYLNNQGGGYVGLWKHSIAPYLVGPMQALTEDFLNVVVSGPARSGKTEIGRNWMMQSILTDPANMIFYANGDDQVKDIVRMQVNPMIELHKSLSERLGHRKEDNSLFFKRFIGMGITFWPATYGNLIGKTAPRLILTELDALDKNGLNTLALADQRRMSFGRESKIYAESHPDLADGLDPRLWTRGIMAAYKDSDRRVWYWACPECGDYSSPNPGAVREMRLEYDPDLTLEEIRETAGLLCPSCGAIIRENQRKDMNLTGKWVAAGQEIARDGTVTGRPIKSDTAGFWIVGVMSPFLLGGIGALAEKIEKGRRKYAESGDDEDLKIAMVKTAGIPYSRPASARHVDAEALSLREDLSLSLGKVPPGARYLTAAMDIQGNRFEVLVRAWGAGEESWIISYQQIFADPSRNMADWDDVILRIMRKKFPLQEDPSRGMQVLGLGYDSGGEEGVTTQAYAAWRRAKRLGLAKKIGIIDGREVLTILPLKGMASPHAPFLRIKYPDSQNSKKFARIAGDVPLGEFNPNRFKDKSASCLSILEPGPRCVHFPRGLGNLHEFYLQLASEERDANGRWQKRKGSPRNEAWDLLVMSDVMSSVFGGYKLNWDNPPLWAKPLSENPLVSVIGEQDNDEIAPAREEISLEIERKRRLKKIEAMGRQLAASSHRQAPSLASSSLSGLRRMR